MVGACNKDITCLECLKIQAVAIALLKNLNCIFPALVVCNLGAIATVYREAGIAILLTRGLKRLTISGLIH